MATDRPNQTDVLSVVIPCFNEEKTVKEILDRVLDSPLVGEVIAIDDASTDRTLAIVTGYSDPRLRVLSQPVNCGKGAALRRGFAKATKPYVIVQDADLEYDPVSTPRVLAPLLSNEADVVYGSRFSGGDARRILYFWHTVGNRVLTLASNMFTNLNLTDMETCYKAFRREVIQRSRSRRTASASNPRSPRRSREALPDLRGGHPYYGRTYADGKKIGWRDGVRAVICIVAYSPPGVRFGVRRASPLIARLTGFLQTRTRICAH